MGNELYPRWLSLVGRLKRKGWKKFSTAKPDEVREIRAEITDISAKVGLPTSEFRLIVQTVQQG